jgi:hypothetical protein
MNVARCRVRGSSNIIGSWVSNSLAIILLSCSLCSSPTTYISSTFMSSSISSEPISFLGMSSSPSLFVPLFLLLTIGSVCDFLRFCLGGFCSPPSSELSIENFFVLEFKFGVFLWLGCFFRKYSRTMNFSHLQLVLGVHDGHWY